MKNEIAPDYSNMSRASSKASKSDVSFLDYRAYTRLSEQTTESAEYSLRTKSSGNFQNCKSLFDDQADSSSVLKWTTLANIYPISGTYGGITSIYSTKSCYVLGTTKGAILIFSTKQILLHTLVPQIMSESAANYLRSAVEKIVVSADGTHLAASYESGECFIWNLNADTEVKNEIDESREGSSSIRAILHITDHKGRQVNGIGFMGLRHTALIVSDNSGCIFYHSGFRTRFWSLTYSSKQILNISSGEKLIHSQTVPNVEGQPLHMIAVLTTSRFAVISTAPRLTTLFLQNLRHTTPTGVFSNGCLSWHDSGSKIALSLNTEVTVITIKESSPFSVKKKVTKLDEVAIILHWLTQDLLGVLTESCQFFILDVSGNLEIVGTFDFLIHDLLMPPNKHFTICDRKLQLLTNSALKIGKFASWSDIVLNQVQMGNYIRALKFIKSWLLEHVPLWQIIRLKKIHSEREQELVKPLYNLALAALKYVINGPDTEYDDVYEVLSLVLSTLNSFEDENLKKETTSAFLEKSMNFFHETSIYVFYEVLMNLIMEESLSALPAILFKSMLTFYANEEKLAIVEDMVVMLDPRNLDIDLAVKLCQKYELFSLLIYIWNNIFDDYSLPLVDAVLRINDRLEEVSIFNTENVNSVNCIFDYLSFILTGRQYPRNQPIAPIEKQIEGKSSLYYMLFSGTCIQWPPKSGKRIHTKLDSNEEPAFPYFKLLLDFNTRRMLSMLNEIFEDSLLNEGYTDTGKQHDHQIYITRQYMIDVILDIMKEKHACTDKALMAIFIACNIAKYPQFIKLSSRAMDGVATVICELNEPDLAADSQRALECLLSVYIPSNPDKFITTLKEKCFKRVLFILYIKTKKYFEILPLALSSPNTNIDYGKDFSTIIRFVLFETKSDALEHLRIAGLIRENFDTLVQKLGSQNAANVFENFDSDLHLFISQVHEGIIQQEYLEELYLHGILERPQLQHLKNLYFEVACQYKERNCLLSWLGEINFKNLDVEHAIDLLLSKNNYEAAAVIHQRLQAYTMVVDDMIFCIVGWFKQGGSGYEILSNYLDMAIEAIGRSNEEKQSNWTKLIACFMKLYGEYKDDAGSKQSCNRAFQQLFVRLAMAEAPGKDRKKSQLWNILTSALEHQEVIMMKAQDLRTLLSDVLTAYEIEWHIYDIILTIIQKSSVGLGNLYESTLMEGWSIINDECEICGKKLWGLGLSTLNFLVWERNRFHEGNKPSECTDADLTTVSFRCHHLFHKKCLQNLGQRDGKYFCLTCKTE